MEFLLRSINNKSWCYHVLMCYPLFITIIITHQIPNILFFLCMNVEQQQGRNTTVFWCRLSLSLRVFLNLSPAVSYIQCISHKFGSIFPLSDPWFYFYSVHLVHSVDIFLASIHISISILKTPTESCCHLNISYFFDSVSHNIWNITC